MTRLASVAVSCIVVLLAVLPSGLAGPACATKNYRQQQCIERCKAKWGFPGFSVGGDRWGSVMHKVADKSTQAVDAAVSQACGFGPSSAGLNGALAGASESTTSTSSHSSSTQIVQTTTSSSSVPTASSFTSSSSSSSFESSANLFDGFVPSSTSTSSTPTTTSTSSTPTSTSTTTQEFTPTSEPPPPPPPTSTTSSNEATPTSDSGNDGNDGNNGSGDDKGTKDQGSSGSSNSNSGNSGSTSNSDIQAYLKGHNLIRTQHGAADLTWSDDAASKAQTWANNCVFEHSGGSLGPFGENLAAGTGSSYDISEAIKSWTDEVKDYDSSHPQASHFTQVVWKGSTQVGCAVTSCDGIFDASFGKAKYFVCEYFPQGNIIGQFAANVQA